MKKMNSLIIFVLIASFTFFESSVQASSSPKYEACGFSSEDNFVTWSNSVNSNTPLLYPTDESELASILKTAAKHDCRVRVRGAGMTANGAVTQLLEEKVVVVSLFKFQNIPDWQNSISDTGVATISAGQSFFELMKMTRPLGWLFPSPKAGYAGSIGGIVSNSVTGGAVGGGFVYESVVALRVMNSDGTAQDITDSTQLPLYVGAYGLTGIILAVRFQMAPDLGSNPKVLNYQYPMASQDPNIILAWTTQFTADQTALFSTHSYVECFLNPWPDQVTLLNNVTCLTNVPTGQPFPDPSDPEGSASLKASYEAIYQGMTIDPIYRNLADAGCDIFNVDLCDPLFLGPTLCEDPVSRAYGGSLVGFISIAKLFSASQSISSNGPVDLFWQNQATPFSDLSYFIPKAQFGNALGIFLQTYLPFLVLGDSSTFLPTGYLTWRLIVPKHASAFEYLTPGAFYYHVDIIQLNYAHPRDKYAELDTLDVFQVIEKQWILLGGLPHQGKGWGYGTYEQWFFGQHNSPFITNPSLYTSDQITQLSSVIQPLFAAGSQIREFDPASYVPFEIRHLDGRTCADFNYLNCISEECSDQLVCVQSTATIFTTSITILFFTFFTTIFFF